MQQRGVLRVRGEWLFRGWATAMSIRFLSLVAWLCMAGCGASSLPTYPVTGEVVFPDGSPLSGGVVEFRSLQGTPAVVARGEIGQDGKFSLTTFKPGDGAIAGEHQVMVSPAMPRDTDDLPPAERLRVMQGIDPKFTSYQSSGLQFIVKPDAGGQHFRVTVQPPRS
jgi:hypothetical protein